LAARRRFDLIVSKRALGQLQSINTYIAERNAPAAQRVIDTIYQAIDRLLIRPGMGRPGSAPKTREWSASRYPYVIVYEVSMKSRTLTVMGVFHTAQGERTL
jgi:plasmid stabilization system protein ParE